MTLSRDYGSKHLWMVLLLLFLAGFLSAEAAPPSDPQTRQSAPRAEAAAKQKPIWRWSVDERLAARFDAVAMAAREAEQEAVEHHVRELFPDLLAEEEAQMKGPPAPTEMVDGSKTPELLLPGELFGLLLNRGFPQEEEGGEALQQLRDPIEQRAAALGFGRDLWERLGKAAAPYLRSLHAANRRHRAGGADDENEESSVRLCRARSQAFESATAEFGEEAFLRLLYEAVAPDVRPTYILESRADYQRHAENLRFWEGGCR